MWWKQFSNVGMGSDKTMPLTHILTEQVSFFRFVEMPLGFVPLYDPHAANKTCHRCFSLHTDRALLCFLSSSGHLISACQPFHSYDGPDVCSNRDLISDIRIAYVTRHIPAISQLSFTCIRLSTYSAASINNYRRSLVMQQRADAFPTRCIKRDWSLCFVWHLGAIFPKSAGAEGQKLGTPLTKTLAITTHSQLTGHGHSTGLRAPAAAVIKVSSHKYSCAFNDPTSLHSAWIMNMMRKLRGQSGGGGNGDGVEATSKYPASVAILVLSSPKVNKEGERGQWRHIFELVA